MVWWYHLDSQRPVWQVSKMGVKKCPPREPVLCLQDVHHELEENAGNSPQENPLQGGRGGAGTPLRLSAWRQQWQWQ